MARLGSLRILQAAWEEEEVVEEERSRDDAKSRKKKEEEHTTISPFSRLFICCSSAGLAVCALYGCFFLVLY